jgi:hypothetical protein
VGQLWQAQEKILNILLGSTPYPVRNDDVWEFLKSKTHWALIMTPPRSNKTGLFLAELVLQWVLGTTFFIVCEATDAQVASQMASRIRTAFLGRVPVNTFTYNELSPVSAHCCVLKQPHPHMLVLRSLCGQLASLAVVVLL